MTELTVALVQDGPVFLNLAASVAKARGLIADASEHGADIVVFGECWLSGYPVWLDVAPGAALWGNPGPQAAYRLLLQSAPALDGPELVELAAIAVETGVDVIIGINERAGSSLYNSVLHLGADGRRNLHRKVMPTYSERLVHMAADASTLNGWPSRFGTLGALICWEHWMPLVRAAQQKAGAKLHFALWPAVTDLHFLASRHYAFEAQCFVAAAGSVLTREDLFEGLGSLGAKEPAVHDLFEGIPAEPVVFKDGGSALIGPDSLPLGDVRRGSRETIFATVDLARVAEGRLYLDGAGHFSRPDLFELRVDKTDRRSG